MKSTYIIVGDNNFWYATTPKMSFYQAAKQFARVKKEIKEGLYTDGSKPNAIYLYEATEVDRLKVK